jgi:hypothetical protein
LCTKVGHWAYSRTPDPDPTKLYTMFIGTRWEHLTIPVQ